MRALAHRVLAAVAAAILLGAVWALWESRPQLTGIGGGGAERALGFVAWVGGVLLVVGLLVRLLGRDRRRTAAVLPIRNLRKREPRNNPERAIPRKERKAMAEAKATAAAAAPKPAA